MQLIVIDDSATLADLDEALRHLSLVPVTQRVPAWHRYLDEILDRRATLDASIA